MAFGNIGQRHRHIDQLARHQRQVGIGEGGAQFDGAGGVADRVADEIDRRGQSLAARVMQCRSVAVRPLGCARAWMRGRSVCGRAKETLIGWIW